MSIDFFWIATTARTGSNFFCDLLYEQAELQTPKEFLNHDFLRKQNLLDEQSRPLMTSVNDFMDKIAVAWNNTTTPLCIKALYSQFDTVRSLPGIPASLTAHPVVMLVRRDIVAQAVSQYIARATGRWTSKARPRSEKADLVYDFDVIDAAADRIEEHNARWRRTLQVAGAGYLEVSYEEVRERPSEIVAKVAGLWGLTPRSRPQAVRMPHAPQTTELNARFIEQYRRDKARAIFAPR